jgi:hypothetical protein
MRVTFYPSRARSLSLFSSTSWSSCLRAAFIWLLSRLDSRYLPSSSWITSFCRWYNALLLLSSLSKI